MSTDDRLPSQGDSPPAQCSGLRRRWNRVCATMLLVSVASAVASTMVVTGLADGNRKATVKVGQELDAITRLRRALQAEEGAGQLLLSTWSGARRNFLRADGAARELMAEAAGTFDDAAEHDLLNKVEGQWKLAVWFVTTAAEGNAGDIATGADSARMGALRKSFNEQMTGLFTTLDALADTVLERLDRQLEDGTQAQRRQLVVLYTLLGFSLATTLNFARRTRRDVLSPISKLREATWHLGIGDFDHRVDLDRDDEFGELATTFNTMADALDTNRRQLTAQLYGQARLAAIVEFSDQAVLGLSPDLVVNSWNPGAERLYGYTAEEAVGRSVLDLLLPPDRGSGRSFLHRVAEGERVSGYETEVKVRDGRVIPISVSASPIIGPAGVVVGISSIAEDISERKTLKERLHHQAFHDPLTNLANRALLKDRLEHALVRQARSGGLLGVLLLDLDDFKVINDSLGHRAGDELLASVADQLRQCIREADTLARLGGDEFAILLEDLTDPGEAAVVAARVVETLSTRFSFQGETYPVSASVGIALADAGSAAPDDVIRDADVAMYLSKNTAKGTFTIFEPGMHLTVKKRLKLKADLARAMDSDQLVLHYQPIVDLDSARIVGVEALVRWQHPELGMVSPAEFIPVAEQCGLIVPLGLWVLETACRDVESWEHAGDGVPPLRVSVNVSGRQLEDPHFVDSVRRILDRVALEPSQIVLEITESVFVAKAGEGVDKLHQLKALGVQLAIDDFGTGYSSLSSLQHLPVDVLKIDKSFVDRIEGLDEAGMLARAVLGLGRTLQLQTVAEGVESLSQVDELRRLDCNLAQGYYFARPVDAATVEALLREGAGQEGPTPPAALAAA